MKYNFNNVVRNFNRMCSKYNLHCDADECPIAALIDEWEKERGETWDENCIFFATEEPEAFADDVMTWAENNSEEAIYPTTRDIINKIRALMQVDESRVEYEEFLDMPLNKTAAEYFGIIPINENKLV